MTSTLDLTPREVTPRKKRKWLPMALIAVVVVAIALLLVNALGNASLFFKNADEAVRDRSQLASKRFQVQGTVVNGSVKDIEVDGHGAVQFSIVFNGVRADVVHTGDTTSLFKPGVPVVLEGRWVQDTNATSFPCGADDGWYIATDRLYAKHDATYTAKQAGRLEEAAAGGTAAYDCPASTSRS